MKIDKYVANMLQIAKRNKIMKHEDYMIEQLKDPDFQKEWIYETVRDYIETGDYNSFFRGLEYVIKARMTVTQFAKNIGMDRVQLVDILHGKNKNPSLQTITKILSGFGYTLSVSEKTA